MARAKLEKKINGAVPSFETILVCNDKNLRPFVEAFVFEPENVTQKSLGTLLGVFEITDASEDSSYIVNYLSSVIKKEYFSKPKRTPIDSFEAALHRANLALSKLAEHGNVKWIGKFNALVAIIEKNNLHLTQTGTAAALLLRAKGLTEISENLSPSDLEPHPLKTFVNVSSGRLELQDKLIVSTDGIFEIFSTEEIKKSALRFSGEKFIQFLKTALGHELEKAAVLVIDMLPPDQIESAPAAKKDKTFNAFSQSAFARETVRKPAEIPADTLTNEKERPEISEQVKQQIKAELQNGQKESPEGQPGHIYIKETLEESMAVPPAREYFSVLNEKLDAAKDSLKRVSKRSGRFLLDTAKGISRPKVVSPDNEISDTVMTPEEIEPVASEPTIIVPKKPTVAMPTKVITPKEIARPKMETVRPTEEAAPEKILPSSVAKSGPPSVFDKLSRFSPQDRPSAPESEPPLQVKIGSLLQNLNEDLRSKKILQPLIQKTKLFFAPKEKRQPATLPITATIAAKKTAASLLPDFSKIKNLAARLDQRQRLYAILIILGIIIVPFFGLKLSAYLQSKNAKPIEPPAAAVVLPLAQDKNVVRVASADSVYAENGTLTPVNLNGKIFSVSASQITDLLTKTPTLIPNDFGQVKLAIGMDDLNLIFLLSQDNKIISFSPAVGKFQPNSLSIPANSNITAGGTYLTYLYLVDSKNNQIYRFPRATGGFGAPSNWLKDTVNLSQITGLALSDNIFITDGSTITELFKGQKQNFNLEATATPITPFKVFTKPGFANIYILDKQNSRIAKVDPSGNIVAQYYNSDISNANDFTVDEPNNAAYFSVAGEIKSFQMN